MKIDAIKQKEILSQLDNLRSFVENLETSKGCISCLNWNYDKGVCNLANLEPPADVKANGCESWEIWDEIPF